MNTATYQDNRDASEMHKWHEARIEALKARIAELEKENRQLKARPGEWDDWQDCE